MANNFPKIGDTVCIKGVVTELFQMNEAADPEAREMHVETAHGRQLHVGLLDVVSIERPKVEAATAKDQGQSKKG
jgi:hypothetical protein